MLAVLFGIKCKKKVLAKLNNAQKSAITIGKRLCVTQLRSVNCAASVDF